jgi:hypothetical protein
MLDTKCTITIYELDGKEGVNVGGPKLIVRSRDRYRSLVEIEVDGKRVVVNVRDLRGALTACEQQGA